MPVFVVFVFYIFVGSLIGGHYQESYEDKCGIENVSEEIAITLTWPILIFTDTTDFHCK